jgi:hypothetical protein
MKNILILGTFIIILTSCQSNSYCECEDLIRKVRQEQIMLDAEIVGRIGNLSWNSVRYTVDYLALTDKDKDCAEYINQMNDEEADKWMKKSRCYDESSNYIK